MDFFATRKVLDPAEGSGTAGDVCRELGRYFEFYNHRRWHHSLDYQTPDNVYWSTLD